MIRYDRNMTKANFMQSMKLQVICILCILSSCTFTDNETFDPGFLILEKPTLKTTSLQGDEVHQIKHVWVIVDGINLGIFPLPSKVPIISTGKKVTINLRAGVNQNADLSTSIEYPFFNSLDQEILIEAGKSYELPLQFTYKQDAKFDFTEGFELAGHVLVRDLDEIQDTRITVTDEDKRSGNKSGSIVLDKSLNIAQFTTEGFFSNSNNKRGSVYLEFDFKTNVPFYVGYEIEKSKDIESEFKVILSPTTDWKRAYIDLSSEISGPNVISYRPIFGVEYLTSAGEKSKTYIDNVKLVHF